MTFKNKILLSLLLIYSFSINAQIKIVTSTTPIASLIAMLLEDQAIVKVIAANNGCPHHYHAKPSDLKKVHEADYVVYIDQNFDGFISNLLKKYRGNIFKISDIQNLKLLSDKNEINWHIWLDLDNVELILTELSKHLITHFPEQAAIISQNLIKAKQQILALRKFKNEQLNPSIKAVLIGNDLAYLFSDTDIDFVKLDYQQHSLKSHYNLKNKLSSLTKKCLIISNEQNKAAFDNFKTKIVQIDPEHWQANPRMSDDFVTNYTKIIEQLAVCRKD